MDWIPAISSSSIILILAWLSRNLIITRLTNSVKHEYDTIIENIKTELRNSEAEFKADLKNKESQILALRSGALTSISYRQNLVFSRQINAIEQLWGAVVSLAPEKSVSTQMSVIKFEAASKEAANNPEFRKLFENMNKNTELKTKLPIEAEKIRPFISPIAWAYYTAYQAIVFHAVIKLHMLKIGLDMPEVIDSKAVTKLVKVALPHQTKYIEEHGHAAFHYLLDELETKMLLSFELMLKGEEADKQSIENAAAIIKESENLMKSSSLNNEGK